MSLSCLLVVSSFNAFAALPKDLAAIATEFTNKVRVDETDTEYMFLLSELKLPAVADGRDPLMAILDREYAELKKVEGESEGEFELSGLFSVKSLDATAKKTRFEQLLPTVIPDNRWLPFYCAQLKSLNPDNAFDRDQVNKSRKQCGEDLKQILAPLSAAKSHVQSFVVERTGYWGGDNHFVRLYLRSAEDRSQFLVIYFDIVHEI